LQTFGIGKHEEHGCHRHRWGDNIIMDLKEIKLERVDSDYLG
jgi:hypothetical protein